VRLTIEVALEGEKKKGRESCNGKRDPFSEKKKKKTKGTKNSTGAEREREGEQRRKAKEKAKVEGKRRQDWGGGRTGEDLQKGKKGKKRENEGGEKNRWIFKKKKFFFLEVIWSRTSRTDASGCWWVLVGTSGY